MKHFPLLFALLVPCLVSNAQEIKYTRADFSDFIPLLKDAGFELFSYDISSLKDDTYIISLEVMEYSDGSLVKKTLQEDQTVSIANRDFLSFLPEDRRRAVIESGDAYDAENGIYRLARKISIGFSPKADSLKNVKLIVDNMGVISSTLRLKPMSAPEYKGEYLYDILPFKLDTINVNGFTPLLLLGSYWYDKPFKVARFYADDELSGDLSSATLKLIPHYFVLGIQVQKLYGTYNASPNPPQDNSVSIPISGSIRK